MKRVKIRKIGNSLGAIFPAEVIQILQVSEGDEIFVTEERDGVKLTNYDPDFEKVMEAYEKGRKKYRNALRKLAE